MARARRSGESKYVPEGCITLTAEAINQAFSYLPPTVLINVMSQSKSYTPTDNDRTTRESVYELQDFVDRLMLNRMEQQLKKYKMDVKDRAEQARAMKIEAEVAVKLEKYVSVDEIMEKESNKAGTVARALDSVVGNIVKKHPEIPRKYLTTIDKQITLARNRLADTLRTSTTKEPIEEEQEEDAFGGALNG